MANQKQYWLFEVFGTDPNLIGFFGDAGIIVPSGTTAERPPSPVEGHLRLNTDTNLFEGFFGGLWQNIGTGGGGSGTYIGLTDTDGAYTGEGNRVLKVGSGETGVEFSSGLEIENSGRVRVPTGSYETLVTTDDVVPNKKYVDDQDALQLSLSGGLMTGVMNSGGNSILGLPLAPTSSDEAASKAYVDSLAAGFDFKESVHVATAPASPGNLAGTYDNTAGGGGPGFGATLTASTPGVLPFLDGHGHPVGGDVLRILVKDQTSGIENGLYTITNAGAGENFTLATCLPDVADSLDGTKWEFTDGGAGLYYVWYDTPAGAGDPGGPGVGIMVSIATGETAQGVATLTAAAIAGSAAAVTVGVGADLITVHILDNATGVRTPATDVSTGFTISTPIPGTGAPVAWVLTRTTDADNTPNAEVSGGLFTVVEHGSTQASTAWLLTSPTGDAVLGTDPLVFNQFAGGGGAFLPLAGGVMSGSITMGAPGIQVEGSVAVPTSPSFSFVGDLGTGVHQISGAGAIDFISGTALNWSITPAPGALVPAADVAHDIGLVGTKVRDVYADHFLPNFGAVGDPSYSFEGDSTTGMYNDGAGGINFAVGGSDALGIESDGTISVDTASYETLVLADNDVPNKKYVDDTVGAVPTYVTVGGDSGTATAATQGETVNLIGETAGGITTTASDAPDQVTFGLTPIDLAAGGATLALGDFVIVSDSADGATTLPLRYTFTNVVEDLDIPNAISADGIVTRTAADTYTSRSIAVSGTGPAAGIEITNGNGVAGNPTLGLDIDNTALAGEDAATGDLFIAYNSSETANEVFTLAELAAGISATGVNNLVDADGDTRIQVEESADEDIVRIDVGDSPAGYGAVANIMTIASSGWTVAMGTADTAATAGADIVFTAGTGNTTGIGGGFALNAGTGGATDAAGGTATITAGAGGGTAGMGGQAALRGGAGAGTNGSGGNVELRSGTAFGTGAIGSITLDANPASTATGAAGFVQVNAGDGNGSTTGGQIGLLAGTGGATGDGGAINIDGGDGGATSGDGGDINLNGGDAVGGGSGGTINMTAGTGASPGGDILMTAGDSTGADAGGVITLATGTSAGTGAGGDITFNAASAPGAGGGFDFNAGTSSTVGNGGGFAFDGGAGGAVAGAGGGFAATAGAGTATDAAGGAVDLTAGASDGATKGGKITLTAGAGGATGIGGAIQLAAASSTGSGMGGSFTGGAGFGGPTGGAGGNARLFAGSALATGNDGGDAFIVAGNGPLGLIGTGGDVNLLFGAPGDTGTYGQALVGTFGAASFGSASKPALGWFGDTDTGFYGDGSNAVNIAGAGALQASFAPTAVAITPSGDAATVTVTAGNGTAVPGGAINITSGSGGGSDTGGGDIDITSGNTSPGGFLGAEAGDIRLTSGNGLFTSAKAGDIELLVGTSGPVGVGGNISLTAGTVASAGGGNISLAPGGGVSSDGVVLISAAATGASPELRLEDDAGNDYVGFKAAAATTSYTLTMPAAAPGTPSVMEVDAAGTVTFTTAPSVVVTTLIDADGDTKVDVEEGADDDTIRMDVGPSGPHGETLTDLIVIDNSLIKIGGVASGAGDGHDVDVLAGLGNSEGSGDGGDIQIIAGTAQDNGDAGTITITSGTQGGASINQPGGITMSTPSNSQQNGSGAISITTGDITAGGSGSGGSLTLSTGDARGASGQGGAINITAGNGSVSQNGKGGTVTITAGDVGLTGALGTPGNDAGNIILNGGSATARPNAFAGNIVMNAGAGGSTSGSGGSVDINAGQGTQGGSVTIDAGRTKKGGLDGGDITLTAGNSDGGPAGTTRGGNISLFAGVSSNGSISGGAISLATGAGTGGGGESGDADGGGLTITTGAAGVDRGSGGDMTITLGAGATSATAPGSAGGSYSMTAGAGGPNNGAAGTVTITAGAATGTLPGTPGGAVDITGGAGSGSKTGGAVTLTGGAQGAVGPGGGEAGGAINLDGGAGANDGDGGAILITGGAAGSSGTGGAVEIRGGQGSGTSSTGGSVLVAAAASAGSDKAGGTVTIDAGKGGSAANGGAITVSAGDGGTTSGNGADLTLNAGNADGSGSGGLVNINAGTGASPGGSINLTAGDSTSTDVGGAVNITAGTGGTGAGGNGGALVFTAGDAGAASAGDGGDIELRPGALDGGGADGVVRVIGPTAGAGEMRLEDDAGGEYFGIKAPSAVTTSYTLTMPAALPGVSGVAVLVDTSGNVTFGSSPAGTVSKFAQDNTGTLATETFTHSLGSTDVIVQVYDLTASPTAQFIPAAVEIIDANNVDITLASPPGASGEYRVVIMA